MRCLVQQTHGWSGVNLGICECPSYLRTWQEMVLVTLHKHWTFWKKLLSKISCLIHPDVKVDFLAFSHQIVVHYLTAAKFQKQLSPNIIYPRKGSWKRNAAFTVNGCKESQHFIEKSSQRRYMVCLTYQKLGVVHCARLDFLCSQASKSL